MSLNSSGDWNWALRNSMHELAQAEWRRNDDEHKLIYMIRG
jgi:hypothetical protein